MNSETSQCNFDITWEKVKQVTGWSDYKELANFVGSSSQSVSGVKKRGKFPIEWAFKIAKTFNSNTDWLLTDEGDMRRDSVEYPLAETIKNADIISSDKHVPVPLVTTGKTPPGVSGSHPADPERPLGWFYEWLEDELRGKSVTEIMRFAVKIKAELDKEG